MKTINKTPPALCGGRMGQKVRMRCTQNAGTPKAPNFEKRYKKGSADIILNIREIALLGDFMDGERKFVRVSTLKPGGFILIEDGVCQIKGIDKSKPGRHGSTKARISAFDIFTGQKKNLLKPTSAEVDVPIIKKSTAQVVAIMGSTVQIMDMKSYQTMDVRKPDIPGLQSGVEVEYIQYGSHVKISGKK